MQPFWALQHAYLHSVNELHWDWCQHMNVNHFSMYPRYLDYKEKYAANVLWQRPCKLIPFQRKTLINSITSTIPLIKKTQFLIMGSARFSASECKYVYVFYNSCLKIWAIGFLRSPWKKNSIFFYIYEKNITIMFSWKAKLMTKKI